MCVCVKHNTADSVLTVNTPPVCSGVVPEPTHQVEEEERLGAKFHAGRKRGPERGGLGERGGGRGVQQAAGPRLGRRQDPPAAEETPPGVLRPAPRAQSRVTIARRAHLHLVRDAPLHSRAPTAGAHVPN